MLVMTTWLLAARCQTTLHVLIASRSNECFRDFSAIIVTCVLFLRLEEDVEGIIFVPGHIYKSLQSPGNSLTLP